MNNPGVKYRVFAQKHEAGREPDLSTAVRRRDKSSQQSQIGLGMSVCTSVHCGGVCVSSDEPNRGHIEGRMMDIRRL
jgi:hypothetical protein